MSIYKTHMSVGHVEDMPVTVHYEAHKAHRGSTDGPGGPKLEPDEPAWIEIDYVSYDTGLGPLLLQLTKPDEEMLRERIAEHLNEMANADRD